MIFISYAREDLTFVQKLYNSLGIEKGVSVWVDFEGLRPGKNWPNEINQALESCNLMLLIVTSHSMASDNVADEWQQFRQDGKTIIPLKLEDVKLHFQLSNLHYIDFYSQSYSNALDELCRELLRLGVVFNEFSTPVQINKNKTGNLFWLSHDLIELYRWLFEGVEKQWLDIGLRQSCHHMVELELDTDLINQVKNLINRTYNLQESEWTPAKRQSVALEVRDLFNTVAQIAQKADPDFNSGPG